MTKDEALQWIANLFEEPAGKVTPETAKKEIGAWDSLGVLSLMAGLDEKFGILISEDDLQQFRKVGDIIEFLERAGKIS